MTDEDKITITVNGKEIECNKGDTYFEAINKHHIGIPCGI